MVTGGALPEGIQLDAQSGQISGVPANTGAGTGPRIGPPPVWTDSRSISISVTDSALPATQITQTLTIVVQGRGTTDPQ
jgi:putative Ig domain-containing protein